MADQTKTLAWRLIVETTGIEQNTRKAANSLSNLEGMAGKAGTALKVMSAVAAAAVFVKLAANALQIADAYAEMTNKLRSSTEGASELHAVQLELIGVAQSTRTTIEGAADAYGRMHDAVEGLGLSQRDVLQLTETVSQTMQLSGQSAEQAAAGVGRFAVALEQGTLSARDFKALLKESPELIKALADGLGVSRAELRLMAEQGKLTSDVLINALGNAAPEVAEKFSKLAPTMKDAFASAGSSFKALLGEFDQGLGLTESLARSIMGASGSAKEFAQVARELGINLSEAFQKAAVVAFEFFNVLTLQSDVTKSGDILTEEFKRIGLAAQEARDAINKPVDLSVKSAKDPKVLSADQVKVMKDFNDALLQTGDNAMRAAQATSVLGFEISQGKEWAAAYQAELNALNAGKDLETRFRKAFEEKGLTFGAKELEAIQALIKPMTELEQRGVSLKNAWSVVNSAMESGLTPAEKATRSVNELNDALIRLSSEELLHPEQIEAIKRQIKEIQEGADSVTQAWKQAGRAVVDNVVDALAEGSFSIKKFVGSTVKEVGRIIIQMLILKAIEGTTFGKFVGIGKNAMGNAFSHGHLVPFAMGGVVTQPTLFPMANGAGLMGEAGPEAVMPLARMSSGKLGVEARPANISVVNNTGVQAVARIERTRERTSIVLEAAELGAQMAENRMTRSMRSGYGATSAALQRTYALRRRG